MYDSSEIHVSLSEAKQKFGDLVKRAAYGRETIVLEFHGKPIAAIVPYIGTFIEEPRSLREPAIEYRVALRDETRRQIEHRTDAELVEHRRRMKESLVALNAIRNQIAKRRGGVPMPDSVELLREAREERDDQLSGLS
jgi:prevent-host-death family protein